jgi:hypothetical protein
MPDMKTARWPRLKKWSKRLLFALVALVTLIALGLSVEGYRAKRAWDSFQRDLAARGESLDWQAHVAVPVPDEQNLLATPLLATCFGFATDAETADGSSNPGDPCAELERISSWAITLPGPGDWREGTVVPLTDWQTTLRTDMTPVSGWREPWELSPASAVDDLRFVLGLHQAELDEIRAAARRPFAQLLLDPAVLSESLIPRLSRLRSLARPFSISGWTELKAGNPEAAATEIETVLALSDAAASQPLLISMLVRIAMLEWAIQPLWAGLAERRWDDAQLARLERRLEQVNVVANMQRCLRGERVFALALLTATETRSEPRVEGEDFIETYRALRWWPRAIVYRNLINIAGAYQVILVDPLDPAGPSIRLQQSEEHLALKAHYQSFSPYNVFAPMLLPAVDKSLEKAVASQATITLARVACALERHRLATGHYPESLAVLTPRFLVAIPPDPVNGGPLLYHRDDPDRYILYSVGLNETDDGGVASVPAHGSLGREAPQGDWVWRSHPVTTD